tara:strand:- start:23 stop:553 length:531 start_codon:yes stop_codon:yes gene_type:complete
MSVSVNPYPRNSPRYRNPVQGQPKRKRDDALHDRTKAGTPLKVPLGKQLEGSFLTPLFKVVRSSHDRKPDGAEFMCRCKCGTEKIVMASPLMRRTIRSCGCLRIGNPRKTTKIVKKKIRYYTDCEYPNGRVVRIYVDNGEVISDSHPHWESDYEYDEAKARMTEVRKGDPLTWNRL